MLSQSFCQVLEVCLAGTQSSPCWWEGLWIKQRFYLTSPAWGPDGRLECSRGERVDLFICPSCILLEYHLPSHPPFKGWEQLLLSCTLPLALSFYIANSLYLLLLLPPSHLSPSFSPQPLSHYPTFSLLSHIFSLITFPSNLTTKQVAGHWLPKRLIFDRFLIWCLNLTVKIRERSK